ncbi:GIY-YIG nuclease family protein [bacterium]|nr:GIY-YIG nuclease family protein [bacterium]
MAYIYSITNLQNNKLYIGKTSQPNPYDRWKQHLQLARNKDNIAEDNPIHSMPIVRAISKYGADNFKFRVLEECTEESVNEREKHYIEKYNTADGVGYNCTYGGEGISKPKKYWSNHPQSKPVSCYTLDGEWVRDYESVGLAADDKGNGNGNSPIRFCIKGKTFQAFGYRWSWKGEEPKVVENRVNRRGNVYGINPTLGSKKMWKSQADAAEEISGDRKNNNSIFHSLQSPNNNKFQVSGWYLFRKKPTSWTPATQNRGEEYYKKIATISAEKRKRPVYGVSITTGEIVEFESMSEASFFIKGEGNYKGVPNIYNNLKRIENGETWCNSYGYRWYYKA